VTQTQDASWFRVTDAPRGAWTLGAAQTIITTAVKSSSSPAAAVSTVDLERAPFITAFIVRTCFPVWIPVRNPR
jgi:hypothetical protein